MPIADLNDAILEFASREVVADGGIPEHGADSPCAMAMRMRVEDASDRDEVEDPLVLGFGQSAFERATRNDLRAMAQDRPGAAGEDRG